MTNTDSQIPGSLLTPVFLRIPMEHIVILKYILESYEGLGILRTLRRDFANPSYSPPCSLPPCLLPGCSLSGNALMTNKELLRGEAWADVVILALQDTLVDLNALLDSIQAELYCQRLTYEDGAVPDLSEDWLLADEDVAFSKMIVR